MIRHFSCHPVRLIKHTKKLMDKEEKLSIKILQTLREMLGKKECFEETVSNRTRTWFSFNHCSRSESQNLGGSLRKCNTFTVT